MPLLVLLVLLTSDATSSGAGEHDPTLDEAARWLAQSAGLRGLPTTGDSFVQAALAHAGSSDVGVLVVLARGWPLSVTLETLYARPELQNSRPPMAWGLGIWPGEDEAVAVLLRTRRVARFQPLPFPLGLSLLPQEICANLLTPLEAPALFVTPSVGAVQRVELRQASSQAAWCGSVVLSEKGPVALEVIADEADGPHVVALLRSSVAGTDLSSGPAGVREIIDPTSVLARINRLRTASGAPALELDPVLSEVARRTSAALAQSGNLAHRDLRGEDVRDRLRRANVPFRSSGENLARAASLADAQRNLEESPAHLYTLLHPGFLHMGLGVELREIDGRSEVVLTEVFTGP